jgi:hypothetical protein
MPGRPVAGDGTPPPKTVTFVYAFRLDPLSLAACSIYVVVPEGWNVTLPAELTNPIPLSIYMDVAPDTFQLKVTASPRLILLGLAVK